MSTGSRLPIVTLLLIAANLFAAFALLWQPELIAAYGFDIERPSAHHAVTSMFLHQNLLHLAANMIFLAAVGAAVELATGAPRFLLVYVLGGLAGVVAHLLLASPAESAEPLVGASGAIAACAGYYSVRYIHLRVPIAPKIGVSVATITLLWIGLQLAGAVLRIGSESGGVSFWAHLGGIAAGLVLGLAVRAPDLGQRRLGHRVLDEMNKRSPSAVLTAADEHLLSHPDDVRALRQLAVAAQSMGEREREASALLRLLELTPESEQPETVLRLAELGRLKSLPSLRRMLLADRLRLVDAPAAEALLLSVAGEPAGEPQRPEALLALAGLKWESSRGEAEKLLNQLRVEYPLHPAMDLARARGWVP